MSVEKPIMLRLRSKVVREALRAEADRRGLPNLQPIIEEWLTQFVLGRPLRLAQDTSQQAPGHGVPEQEVSEGNDWGWKED